MTSAVDITPEQLKALLALLDRFIPGVTVWAYGSRVKHTSGAYSDLDLAVFASIQQKARVSELKEAIAESSDIPFLVDIHIWDEIPERFRANIKEAYAVLVAGSQLSTSTGRN